MIPKIIHYCWLSNNPIPADMQRYMQTWHEKLPDYEFVHWNFDRFPIEESQWVKEAFGNKKYAFAADYIRMYALYTMGGIYLDMDVEVLKPYDDLLSMEYFLCYENSSRQVPEVAAFGAEKGCWWIKPVLEYYDGRSFVKDDGTFDTKVLPCVVKDVLNSKGISINSVESPCSMIVGGDISQIQVLPCDYFSPKSYATERIKITSNTYSIHQFSGSWVPWEQRLERRIWIKLGMRPHRIMWHVDRFLSRLFHIRR